MCWWIMHWSDVKPFSTPMANISMELGRCERALCGQQKALTSINWMLARADDGGPALNWHWISVALTCNEHKNQLKIVLNIE